MLSACAKVADPLPPVILHPGTVTDLEGIQVGDRFQIVFSLPPEEIRWVEVYRQCGTILTPSEKAEPLARIERNKLLVYREQEKFLFEDRPGLSQTCSYTLRFVNRQGRRSPFSNIVQAARLPPAQPPSNLRREVQQDRIIVRWDPPTENIDGSRPVHLVGYLVNSKHFVSNPEYTDLEFQFGEVQSYQVQSVTHRADPLIFSEFSDTLKVVPRDEFPPSVPQNITALDLEGKVRILWDTNKEADLRGYFVYRGTDPNQLEKSSQLVRINIYQDESVTSGKTYYYQVSAVDKAGNESPKSETVSISIIEGPKGGIR
ncbi:MAG: fibronectin type III domain-containing protein [Acidobacteriota bacterium]